MRVLQPGYDTFIFPFFLASSLTIVIVTSSCLLLMIVHLQMSYLAKDKLFPEWKIWTQFFDHESSEGLRLDGLAESHPIEVNGHQAVLSFSIQLTED